MREANISFSYEKHRITYQVPATSHRYTPDFLLQNGVIVETKGRFVTADRKKHRLVKDTYPSLDIRFVFSNPNTKIGKKSKTTYAMWCDQYGFKWAARWVPQQWCAEPLTAARKDLLKATLGWEPSAPTTRI